MYQSLDDALLSELHEWSASLADDRYNPETLLIAAEESDDEVSTQPTNLEVTTMTTLTKTAPKATDLDKWLATLDVMSGIEVVAKEVVLKPEWLDCKGLLDPSNSFAITAGVVKAARRTVDGIAVAKRRLADVNERIQVQEERALTEENGHRRDAPGLNPDGYEYPEALHDLHEEAEKHEVILERGMARLNQIFGWIEDHAVTLELKVEVGHTTTKDDIGNEFRVPRTQTLDRTTLMIGIAKQREFISRNRK